MPPFSLRRFVPALLAAAAVGSTAGLGAQVAGLPGGAGQSQGVLSQPGQGGRDAASGAEAPRTGSLSGVVVEAGSGQPVPGVRVTLSGEAMRGSQSAITDDDGRFGFAGLGVGTVMLRASKPGYVSVLYGQTSPQVGRSGTPIALKAGQAIRDLSFEIPRGGVVTGYVFDEKNRPSVGTPVRLLRWSMASGERTLTSAGAATTDDRGLYRIYGLAPGEYIVSAQPRNQFPSQTAESMAFVEAMNSPEQVVMAERLVVLEREVATLANAAGSRTEPPEAIDGYAPVYYPGTTAVGSAATVSLGVAEERAGVDFALAKVTLARVEGQVIMPGDSNTSSVQLRLTSLDETVPGVGNPSARAGRDGRFSFAAVAPGRYRVTAVATVRNQRSETELIEARRQAAQGGFVVVPTASTSERLWATAEITVAGAPVSNVMLMLRPGLTLSGRLEFDGTAPTLPPNRRVRVMVAPFGAEARAAGANSSSADVGPDGRFQLTGLIPGPYRVQSVQGIGGWSLKSATLAGIDTLDFGLDVTPDGMPPELTVTVTQKTSGITGSIQNTRGAPTAEYTVIVFPADRRYWIGMSRRIRSVRPATDGAFTVNGLPAGDYRIAAVNDVEQGQWYDPSFLEALAPASVPVTLVEGQTRTQDVRVAGG